VLGPAQLVGYRDGISEWGGWEVLVEDWQPYDSYDSEAAARETRLYREGQLTELQWQQVKLDWQQTQLDNLGARS
jgi:hypothetical protein